MLPAEPRPRGSTSEVIDRRRPAGHARTLLITEDEEGEMTAYAVAILRDVEMGAEVVRYLERIDATLAPFGGRFVVHGAEPVALEGTWEGTLIVIGFPDAERARGWYDSAAYREILPLRTRNSRGTAILVDGVGPEHRATDILRPA